MRSLTRIGLAVAVVCFFSTLAMAQNYADVARNTGYRDGLEKGANDARQSKSYSLERHDAFNDGDRGYRSSFGNREAYKQVYRKAFRDGYEQGYRGEQGRGGRRDFPGRIDPVPPRDDRGWGRDRDRDWNRDRGWERDRDRGGFGSAGADTARNTGYRDGQEKGANDARQRKSYRLDRHDYYKDGDHGYRSSFGDKEAYRQLYRKAFQDGYENGYRGRRGRF